MKILIASLLALSALSTQAQTFSINTALSGGINAGQVATLNVAQSGNDVNFTLTANWNTSLLGANVFLSHLYMDYDGGPTLTSSNFANFTGGAALKNTSFYANEKINAGAAYQIDLGFDVSNNARSNRLNNGESVSWTLKGTQASAFQFDADTAAFVHLQNIQSSQYAGVDSIKMITAVPEPETFVLLGLGLIAIAARRRTRI